MTTAAPARATATLGSVWPRLALLLVVGLAASNADGVLAARHGISIYPPALALASAALVWVVVTESVKVRLPSAVLLFGIFVATQVPAVLVAQDQALAFEALLELTKSLWFFFVVVLLAAAVSGPWTIARLTTGAMTALAGLTLVNQFFLGNASDFGGLAVVSTSTGVGAATARHAGPADDPNFWGRLLILAVPLAVALVVDAWQRKARATAVGWAGCVLLLMGGLYLTQSRGSLLGLAVAAVLWLAVAGPKPRKALVLLPLVVIMLASLPGVGSRVATLNQLTGDSPTTDYALIERTAAQQIALAVFVDNPALGVGPANIPVVWDEYKDEAEIQVQRQVAPHNLYLELAAQSGVLGVAGWLVFMLGAMALAVRIVLASPVRPREPIPRDRLLATAVVAGLMGWAVASIFLHLSFVRPVLLVVALVAVMDLQLPMAQRVALIRAGPEPRRRNVARQLTVGALMVCLVAGVVGYVTTRGREWVALVSITVTPQPGDAESATGYQYELLTRPTVVPTYAGVIKEAGDPLVADVVDGAGLDPGEVQMSVASVSDQSTVVVEVRGPQRDLTTDLAEQVAGEGTDYVNEDPSIASFATVSIGPTTTYTARRWLP